MRHPVSFRRLLLGILFTLVGLSVESIGATEAAKGSKDIWREHENLKHLADAFAVGRLDQTGGMRRGDTKRHRWVSICGLGYTSYTIIEPVTDSHGLVLRENSHWNKEYGCVAVERLVVHVPSESVVTFLTLFTQIEKDLVKYTSEPISQEDAGTIVWESRDGLKYSARTFPGGEDYGRAWIKFDSLMEAAIKKQTAGP